MRLSGIWQIHIVEAEYCNHPPYEVKSDRDWEECLRAWQPAFRHARQLM